MAANSLKSCSEDRTMRSVGSLLVMAVLVFSLWPESLDSLSRNRAAASPGDYDTHGRMLVTGDLIVEEYSTLIIPEDKRIVVSGGTIRLGNGAGREDQRRGVLREALRPG